MSTLNSLKMVSSKKPTSIPPILQRRNKLSTKVWEQIQLAKANKEGGTFTVKKFKTVKDYDGSRKTIEHEKRVRQWWFVANDGKVCLNVKYGSRVIEFAKGKTAVEVASADDLIKALEIIKGAVEAGELDTQIEQASGAVRAGFGK
ncbi:DUF6641 family protein [Polynucleobacter sp. MWH-Aus1W21]|uniref:DUF6641 family protein n=1 Tax=Polynucleobacter sp. MWH-Aus1W21 TaxID=1855880 RepID=UPI001BFD1712|nr:DUF6641 family protein [Polynucleobacter sp. MWH-Aus1W21]QWD66026.1 hypothetical protein ICW03_10330 [Polynucleobacter sp. MWH-Aus1W21]